MEEGAGLTGSAGEAGLREEGAGSRAVGVQRFAFPPHPVGRYQVLVPDFNMDTACPHRAAAPGSFPIRVLRPLPGCRARSEGGTAERLWG